MPTLRLKHSNLFGPERSTASRRVRFWGAVRAVSKPAVRGIEGGLALPFQALRPINIGHGVKNLAGRLTFPLLREYPLHYRWGVFLTKNQYLASKARFLGISRVVLPLGGQLLNR